MPKAAGDLVVLKEVIEKSITSKEKYTKLVFEIIESVRKSLICLWEKENKFYVNLFYKIILSNRDITFSGAIPGKANPTIPSNLAY